ncbi:MAG: YeeE/YedE family protein [Nitrospirae bacterium]|nr:YeeE/YedE family protein [Nitrospirota bacterium]
MPSTEFKEKYKISTIITWVVVIIAGAGLSFYLKNFLPVVVAISIVLMINPKWWTIIIMGFLYTAYLHSGWPLLASIVFSVVGKPKRWWPIPAGIAFALTEVFSFYLSERPIGITRGYTVMGSIATYLISPEHVNNVEYWGIYEPKVDWTIALILGTILGSFLSSKYSGEFKLFAVPQLWKQSKGPSVTKRWIYVFLAGIVMGFAARIAGGCVSGLLISGVIQLAPSGFIFMMSLWIGGVITSFLFYRTRTLAVKRESD